MTPTIDSIIPVPTEISRRAWECAHVLVHDFPDRLTPKGHINLRLSLQRDPFTLKWFEVTALQKLYAYIVERRT